MKTESRELWNWIWETDTGELMRTCNRYDKKMGLPRIIRKRNEMDL